MCKLATWFWQNSRQHRPQGGRRIGRSKCHPQSFVCTCPTRSVHTAVTLETPPRPRLDTCEQADSKKFLQALTSASHRFARTSLQPEATDGVARTCRSSARRVRQRSWPWTNAHTGKKMAKNSDAIDMTVAKVAFRHARCKRIARQQFRRWVAFAQRVKLVGHPPVVGVGRTKERSSCSVRGGHFRLKVVTGECVGVVRGLRLPGTALVAHSKRSSIAPVSMSASAKYDLKMIVSERLFPKCL